MKRRALFVGIVALAFLAGAAAMDYCCWHKTA